MIDNLLLQMGCDYYVCGRFAAIAGYTPVCGNLFHHAIEMFLKSHKSETTSERDRRRLGHQLLKIWDAFKMNFPSERLDVFDSLILELDRFEIVRYPEPIVRQGMISNIGWGPPPDLGQTCAPPRPEPRYFIDVDQVDSLVAKLFILLSRNPKVFLRQMKSESRQILSYENREYEKWFS